MGRETRDIDLDSPYYRDIMDRPISKAADMLVLTGMVGMRDGRLTDERADELDRLSDAVIDSVADDIGKHTNDGLENHLVLGQVALNLMIAFVSGVQEAWDLAKLQIDLEEMG